MAHPFQRRPFAVRLLAGLVFVTLLLAAMGLPNWYLLKNLEGEFLPEEDKGRLLSFVFAPEGSTVEYTDRQVRKMEAILTTIPEVEAYGSITAFSMAGPGQANQSILFVRLTDPEHRKRSVQELVNGPQGLRQRFFQEVEGAIAAPIIPKAIGRTMSAAFQLVIQAEDLEKLDGYTQTLLGKLRQSGYLLNARSTFEITKPELLLDIDRNRAAGLELSIEDVSRTLQILFGGLDLSRIKREGKEYEVIAQLARQSRLMPQDLDRIYVRNREGRLIQLSAVVTRREGAAPNAIEHYNRLRSATISASLQGVPLGTAIERVEAMLKDDLPPGFRFAWAGESKEFKDSANEFWFVLVLALIITYMVLAAQFESLLHPLTVVLSVPLAGVGALGLLWLIGQLSRLGVLPPVSAMNINLFSMIGFVLLVGLVTKNAILLVEFANQQMEKGAPANEAIHQAGLMRLRPILMTAFSTIAGILPIAIGFGAGAESRRPMGIVVVGGMITSTFLTLFVVPFVYTVFSELSSKFVRKAERQPEPSVDGPVVVPAK